MNSPKAAPDLVLVGGGLANGLIALRLAASRPELAITIVEAGPTLGGNHTWSFHASDLTSEQTGWIAPLVAHRWDGYEVLFPGLGRRLAIGYRSVTSERFHQVISNIPGLSIRLDTSVESVEADHVRLAGGERIVAPAIIDGRGPQPSPHLRLGYQKFLGREVLLDSPHGLTGPILMDATVPQLDGFRFVYVLPFTADRLLVEDTYYADGPDLDRDALRARIDAYMRERGWSVRQVLREEEGVLPVTLGGDIRGFWAEAPAGIPRAGLRAGLFHPTTGYSLPEAARLADLVAALPRLSSGSLDTAIRTHAVRRWRAQSFFRGLNRMLFLAGSPPERYRVMRRFYGLPESLIRRFYAGRLAARDMVRLLVGEPPVPMLSAVRALLGRSEAKP